MKDKLILQLRADLKVAKEMLESNGIIPCGEGCELCRRVGVK